MTPIHEILSRIRHDPEFGTGEFVIGYLDRVEGTIHRVALRDVEWPEGERRTFALTDETGQVRRIPYHRVREVLRDGKRIWERP